MRKVIVLVLIMLFFAACSNIIQTLEGKKLTGSKPPKAYMEVNGEKHELALGTYCWENTCVDTAGVMDLLAGEVPIQVQAGEAITFSLAGEQEPSETELFLVEDEVDLTEIKKNGEQFNAPLEPGTYYYSYVAWWHDEEDKSILYGDAFYAFFIQVK